MTCLHDIFQYCRNSIRRSSFSMPGHIKLVKGAVDPDPTEYLLPNMEMKKEDQNKPYDSKKSVWISNPKDGGYREGILEVGDIMLEDPAAKCVVAVGNYSNTPFPSCTKLNFRTRKVQDAGQEHWQGQPPQVNLFSKTFLLPIRTFSYSLTCTGLRSARTWST